MDSQLGQLFALADAWAPAEHQLPLRLQPFIPDYVPAIGAPNSFTAPPRPDGEPDFLGLTVLDEPAAAQSDPASLALHLRRQQQHDGGDDGAAPLGWVADPAGARQRLDAWVEQVEALHQADAQLAALAPAPPNLEALMQAWTPDMQAHIAGSPLPDPAQDVDLPTYARMVCGVLDLSPTAAAGGGGAGARPAAGSDAGARALVHSLHALFSLYLEFKHNPAFSGVFRGGAVVAAQV